MSSAHQNLSSEKMVNAGSIDHFHFTVIVAEWNRVITSELEKGCTETLIANGADSNKIRVISVPGSWELVSAATMAAHMSNADAVICIGVVVRGDTPHFDYICQGVTQGLANLCSTQTTPVIYGVLTVNNMQQALDRCGGIHGNKGDEAAATAIKMALLKEKFLHT